MKNKIYTILILGFMLYSCESLNVENPNSPSLEHVTVQNLVTGVEAGMRNELEFYLRVTNVIGREAYYFEPSDPRYTGELMKGPIDASGFLLNRSWSARYNVISTADVLMEKSADKGINGYAKTIQAYQYLLNLNLTYSNGIRPLRGNFMTKDASLKFIADLLDEAKVDLSDAGTQFSFHLSEGFSSFGTPAEFLKFNRGLKARVALYQNDFSAVDQALAESFLDEADLSMGVYHIYGTGNSDLLNPIYEDPTSTTLKFHAHPSLKADAEANDARFHSNTKSKSSKSYDGLTSDVAIFKSKSIIDKFPIITSEELILIRAESNIRKSSPDFATAETDINKVRSAAGLSNLSAITNVDDGVSKLLHERRYSLFAEGHRWIDHRRLNKLSELPTDRGEVKDEKGKVIKEADVVIVELPRPATEL